MNRDRAIEITKGHLGEHKDVCAAYVDWLVGLGLLKMDNNPEFASALSDLHGNHEIASEDLKMVQEARRSDPAQPRCEPPPEHREKRWHWLRNGQSDLVIRFWDSERSRFRESHEHSHPVLMEPEALYRECGWRYVAPCEEPRQPRQGLKPGDLVVIVKTLDNSYPEGEIGRVIDTGENGRTVTVRLYGESGKRLLDADAVARIG